MKKNNTLLVLWGAAGLSLLSGLLLTGHSLNGIGRNRGVLVKKVADAGELAGLRIQTIRHRDILGAYTQYPAIPVRYETLVRAILPAQSLNILATDTSPSLPGWTSRKVSVEFNDIEGTGLGKLLEAGSSARPPWALLECTLLASPTPGRIAKATLVVNTVERSSTENR